MAQEFSKRQIIGFVVALFVATIVTIAGTYFVIDRFVIASDDPLYKKEKSK